MSHSPTGEVEEEDRSIHTSLDVLSGSEDQGEEETEENGMELSEGDESSYRKWCQRVMEVKERLTLNNETKRQKLDRAMDLMKRIAVITAAHLSPSEGVLLPYRNSQGHYRVMLQGCTTRGRMLTPAFLEEILITLSQRDPLEPLTFHGRPILDLSIEQVSLKQRFLQCFQETQLSLASAKTQKRWMVILKKPPKNLAPEQLGQWFPQELKSMVSEMQRSPELRDLDRELVLLEEQIHSLKTSNRDLNVLWRALTRELDSRTQRQADDLQRQKLTGESAGLRKSQAAKVVKTLQQNTQFASLRQAAMDKISRQVPSSKEELPHCCFRSPVDASPVYVFVRPRQRPGPIRQKELTSRLTDFIDQLPPVPRGAGATNDSSAELSSLTWNHTLSQPVTPSSWLELISRLRVHHPKFFQQIEQQRLGSGTQFDQLVLAKGAPRKPFSSSSSGANSSSSSINPADCFVMFQDHDDDDSDLEEGDDLDDRRENSIPSAALEASASEPESPHP